MATIKLNSVKKNIILLGTNNTGKSDFLDSLYYMESSYFKPQVQLPSTRDQGTNLYGKKFNQEFNIIIPFTDREYNSIELNILKYSSIDFGDDDSFELIDNFLDSLSEEETEFHGILYFTNGSSPRFLKHDQIFLERLIIHFGESILKSLIIVQSFSNLIVPTGHVFSEKLQNKLNKLNEYKSKVFEYESIISKVQKYE